ncbi:MAG: 50S ribosomal protein L9 [Alphaproteobacteria bacterium]|nr:50S ribosomal protein L9 [Alphaproteobacteria bacterium]
MNVILLERVDHLGQMGDVVKVKAGYARNYLLPQNKALRATKDNVAYFEAQKAALEKQNAERRKDAEKDTKKLADANVVLIRYASESGHLYGSVTSRDIADSIAAATGHAVTRQQVLLNDAIKAIGLIPVTIALHPEVKVQITLNIARSQEEADIQAKTGRALIAGGAAEEDIAEQSTEDDGAKAAMLEDSALEAEKTRAEEEKAEAAEAEEKAAARAAKKAAKEEAQAAESDAEAESEAAA